MILTDDVDGVCDATQHDSSLASHLARVVSTVAILHVCIISRYDSIIICCSIDYS